MINPDVCLGNIRQILETGYATINSFNRLKENIRELDRHLSAGGAYPTAWEENRPTIEAPPPTERSERTSIVSLPEHPEFSEVAVDANVWFNSEPERLPRR